MIVRVRDKDGWHNITLGEEELVQKPVAVKEPLDPAEKLIYTLFGEEPTLYISGIRFVLYTDKAEKEAYQTIFCKHMHDSVVGSVKEWTNVVLWAEAMRYAIRSKEIREKGTIGYYLSSK